MYGIGANESGQLDGEEIHYRITEKIPRKILLKTDGKIVKIKTGNLKSCVFTDKGEIWHWGANQYYPAEKVHKPFKLLNDEIEDILKKGEKVIDRKSVV